MTVKELKQKLENVPDNYDVFVGERTSDFAFGLVNSAYVMDIPFSEDPDSKPLAKDKVFVLTED